MLDESSLLRFSDDALDAAFVFVVSRCMSDQELADTSEFLNAMRSSAHGSELGLKDISSSLLRDHVRLAIQFYPLQAAPFLTDETAQELLDLHHALIRSWDEILMQRSHMSKWSYLRHGTELNQIDSAFITFLEWMSDVRFMSATDDERKDYLSEFSFNSWQGDL